MWNERELGGQKGKGKGRKGVGMGRDMQGRVELKGIQSKRKGKGNELEGEL